MSKGPPQDLASVQEAFRVLRPVLVIGRGGALSYRQILELRGLEPPDGALTRDPDVVTQFEVDLPLRKQTPVVSAHQCWRSSFSTNNVHLLAVQ